MFGFVWILLIIVSIIHTGYEMLEGILEIVSLNHEETGI